MSPMKNSRVTLKQVAAAAGVSFQTVSKVLNGTAQVSAQTEQRIWAAVRTLHYQPDALARNLRTQKSRMIGYSWTPVPPDQANPVLDQFLQSMMQATARAGYHILPFVHNPADPVPAYGELMNTGRVDGFVLSSLAFHDPRIPFLQEQGFPFVAFGRSAPESDFPYVDVDGASGIRRATEHLIRRGHYQIALLGWSAASRVGRDRLDGYLAALNGAGILPRSDWIVRGDGCFAFGYEATMRWLDCPPKNAPTAIVALNDSMAIGAMRAAQAHGLRVGTDLAITGFDDMPMTEYLTPPLTTIRQPIWQVGQRLASMLTTILAGEIPEEQHVLLEPELIVRSSS